MRSHLVLKSAAEDLDAPEINGALESFPEAFVLTFLPADLAETAAAADNHQQCQQCNHDRSPYRNYSTNTRAHTTVRHDVHYTTLVYIVLAIKNMLVYSLSQKNPPGDLRQFFQNGWEFFNQILLAY